MSWEESSSEEHEPGMLSPRADDGRDETCAGGRGRPKRVGHCLPALYAPTGWPRGRPAGSGSDCGSALEPEARRRNVLLAVDLEGQRVGRLDALLLVDGGLRHAVESRLLLGVPGHGEQRPARRLRLRADEVR